MGYSIVRGAVMADVYRAVENERERQLAKGYTEQHDDARGFDYFCGRIADRAEEIMKIVPAADHSDAIVRRRLFTEVAALAVAALESMDRRPGMRDRP